MAGQPEESIEVLTVLAKNAVIEKRYRDASYFHWLLSQLCLELKKNEDEIKQLFLWHYDNADIYYAYYEVYKYLVSINTCNSRSYLPYIHLKRNCIMRIDISKSI